MDQPCEEITSPKRPAYQFYKSKNDHTTPKPISLRSRLQCGKYVTPEPRIPRRNPTLSDPSRDRIADRTLRSKLASNGINGSNGANRATGSNGGSNGVNVTNGGINRASSPVMITRKSPGTGTDVQVMREKKPRKFEITISSDDEEDDDSMDVSCENPISSDVYYYCDRAGDHKITITSSDLKCLNEGEFLNDVILDFYLAWLKDHEVDSVIAKRIHIFSTFFFSKLTQNQPNESFDSTDKSTPISQKFYARAKNWLKKLDIFSKDFLIVPVNRKSHWFLLIVCYPAEVPEVEDDELATLSTPNERSPCILIFDSLGSVRTGGRYRLTDPLRHLFAAAYKIKYNRDKKFDHILLPDRTIKTTQQTNHYDCGLFLLQYVEQFLAEPEVVLKSTPRSLMNWVDLHTIANKRKTIKNMICTLSRHQYE